MPGVSNESEEFTSLELDPDSVDRVSYETRCLCVVDDLVRHS